MGPEDLGTWDWTISTIKSRNFEMFDSKQTQNKMTLLQSNKDECEKTSSWSLFIWHACIYVVYKNEAALCKDQKQNTT